MFADIYTVSSSDNLKTHWYVHSCQSMSSNLLPIQEAIILLAVNMVEEICCYTPDIDDTVLTTKVNHRGIYMGRTGSGPTFFSFSFFCFLLLLPIMRLM